MKPDTTEQRVRWVNELVDGEAGKFLREDLESMIRLKDREIETYLQGGNVELTFLNEGIKMGLRMAADRPLEMKRENETRFKRMLNKVMGS